MKPQKLIPFLFVAFLFLLSCEEDDSSPVNGNASSNASANALLASKNWRSVQIFNSGTDVTAQTAPLTYQFNSDGTFSVSSSTGVTNGSWVYNANVLLLDGVSWSVLELNSNSLKIDDDIAVRIYFN